MVHRFVPNPTRFDRCAAELPPIDDSDFLLCDQPAAAAVHGNVDFVGATLKPLNMHGPDDNGRTHPDCEQCRASIRQLQAELETERTLQIEASRREAQAADKAATLEEFVRAVARQHANKYVDWASAGGQTDCIHGWAKGIPCPCCDDALIAATIAGLS